MNRNEKTRNQRSLSFSQSCDHFIPPQRIYRQKRGNERKWGKDAQAKFDRFDFTKIAHKFYRPKLHQQAKAKEAGTTAIFPQKLDDHISYEVMSSTQISSAKWQEAIVEL